MPLNPTSGPSGGGAPAGADDELQLNDSGAFGATSDLSFDPVLSALRVGNKLYLVTIENGSGEVLVVGVGGQLFVRAADGDATHTGGELQILSGGSDGQNGGDLTITSGGDSGGGDSGNVSIRSGTSGFGDSGEIAVHAGDAAGQGGQLILTGGFGGVHGGDVLVGGGTPDGTVSVYAGDGSHFLEISPDGVLISSSKVNAPDLPIADPHVVGRLWNNADTVKVSAG